MNTYKARTSNKQKSNRPNNFIEAIKEIGSSIKSQAKDATVGTGRSAMDQLFGAPKNTTPQIGEMPANKPFNFEDFLRSREKQIEFNERQKYARKFREETLVFHRKEEEAKRQIAQIQEELKKLAEETVGLSQEVKKAVFEGVAQGGTYHVSFFDRIKRIIEIARKQITESRHWFQTLNQRRKQKSYYWYRVKKSGTRFMLSHERYMATQAG